MAKSILGDPDYGKDEDLVGRVLLAIDEKQVLDRPPGTP